MVACNYNLKKNKLNCRIYNKNIETYRPTQKKFVKTIVRHVSVGINCYTTVQWTSFPYSCGPFYPVSVNGYAIAWTFFPSGPIYRGPFFKPWTFFPWPFFPWTFLPFSASRHALTAWWHSGLGSLKVSNNDTYRYLSVPQSQIHNVLIL